MYYLSDSGDDSSCDENEYSVELRGGQDMGGTIARRGEFAGYEERREEPSKLKSLVGTGVSLGRRRCIRVYNI